MADKPLRPPSPLTSDLEDLQEYAVSLFIEKLAISLAFAMLSGFIVFCSAMFHEARFMTACIRAAIAFFVSGIAAALVSNVLDMQEDYYKMKGAEIQAAAEQAQIEEQQSTEDQNNPEVVSFKPLNEQNLPNVNQPQG